MPKAVQDRLKASERVASNIKYLRQSYGWSHRTLAQKMAAIGCPIAHTGIYKSEKGDRQITLDELEAYAVAFDSTVNELLSEPGAIAQAAEEVTRRFRDWRALVETHQDLLTVMRRQRDVAADRVVEVTASSSVTTEVILAHLPATGPLAEHDEDLRHRIMTRRMATRRKAQSHGQSRKKT
jgi:transcriptional regulator with XRE-family HTH domain